MSDKFWMVYGCQRSGPVIRHTSRETAINEARRLASMQPGDKFYVLEAVNVVERIEVTVRDLTGEEAPDYDMRPF